MYACRPALVCLLLSILLSVLLSACSDEAPASPEQQIKQRIEQARLAGEQKDHGILSDMLDEGFRDNHGHDKKQAIRLLRVLFLRHDKIYLRAKINNIELRPGQQAMVSLVLAMAGTPLSENLADMRADFHHFDILFTQQDDQWQAIEINRRRAQLDDFL